MFGKLKTKYYLKKIHKLAALLGQQGIDVRVDLTQYSGKGVVCDIVLEHDQWGALVLHGYSLKDAVKELESEYDRAVKGVKRVVG